MKVVVDAGPLLAAANRRDRSHARTAELIARLGRDAVVPVPVSVEVDHLLRTRLGGHAARLFLEALSAGEHEIAYLTPGLLRRAVAFDARFADLGLGLADASVMAVAERHGPAYVRMGRSDVPVVTSKDDSFEIGKASVLRDGSDVAIVGVGQMVAPCLEAAEALKARGISARVINLSTIKPLDTATLIRAARDCGAMVTAEEHNIVSGAGTLVAAALAEACPTPMERVAMQDVFGQSGESDELMREYGLSQKEVLAAAIKVMERKK